MLKSLPALRLLVLIMISMRLVSQQKAAQAFGVQDRTIRNWISQGHITGYRLPSARAIRVDLDEIQAKIKAIPTLRAGKPVFGPRARIINVNAIEALPPREDQNQVAEDTKIESDDAEPAEVVTGGER